MRLRRLIKLPELTGAIAQGPTQTYADIKDGLLPPPLKRGRSSMWVEDEIAVVNAARIARKSDDEIRALVASLVAARAALPEQAASS